MTYLPSSLIIRTTTPTTPTSTMCLTHKVHQTMKMPVQKVTMFKMLVRTQILTSIMGKTHKLTLMGIISRWLEQAIPTKGKTLIRISHEKQWRSKCHVKSVPEITHMPKKCNAAIYMRSKNLCTTLQDVVHKIVLPNLQPSNNAPLLQWASSGTTDLHVSCKIAGPHHWHSTGFPHPGVEN